MQTLTVSTLQGPKKSTFSEKQVVSQTETGPPGPNSRLEGKSICDVLMVEILLDRLGLQKHAGIWVAVALQSTKPLTDHLAQRFCV